jgi:hypothetical protein
MWLRVQKQTRSAPSRGEIAERVFDAIDKGSLTLQAVTNGLIAETMLEMFKLGLKSLPTLGAIKPSVDLKAAIGNGAPLPQRLPHPSTSQRIRSIMTTSDPRRIRLLLHWVEERDLDPDFQDRY